MQASLQRGGIEEGDLLTLDQTLGKCFEDSRELSGGQWQKLALARAFYSQAPILILDEPTAALDARAENQLVTKFLELAENKTVLFVTHRLAMVKKADKILEGFCTVYFCLWGEKSVCNHHYYCSVL